LIMCLTFARGTCVTAISYQHERNMDSPVEEAQNVVRIVTSRIRACENLKHK